MNRRAGATLPDAKTYEKQPKASDLPKLLLPAEQDVRAGRTRPLRSFLKAFKDARKVSR